MSKYNLTRHSLFDATPMMIYATGYIVVKTINDNTMSSVRLSIRLLFRFNGKVYIEDCIFILKIQNSLVYRTLNCYLYCFIILENYIFLWSVRLYWSSYMQTSCKKPVLSEHFPNCFFRACCKQDKSPLLK